MYKEKLMTTHQQIDKTRNNPSTRAHKSKSQTGPHPAQILQRLENAPGSIRPADVLTLQRTIGNRATGRILQAKLKLGPAGDAYEQEADRVAKEVVHASRQPEVQRNGVDEDELQAKPLADRISQVRRDYLATAGVQREGMDEEEELQAKRTFAAASPTTNVQRADMDEEELQAKPNHGLEGGEVDDGVARSIQSAKGSGQPLHDGVRRSMERGFGADFSGVRIHTGGDADTLNRSLNARAFTTGSDIFFGKGQYNPGSSGGQELIAHELTHTVQQGAAGVRRDIAQQANGESISPEIQTATEKSALTVQRKIGFEVETGIPITEIKTKKGTGEKHYFNIFAKDHKINMVGGVMSPDHVPIKRTTPEPDNEHFGDDLPIVEFVSDAIDEDLSDEDFETWANASMDDLKDTLDHARLASPPGDQTMVGGYNFGLPSDGIQYADKNWNRISVQATVDVGLAKVGKLVGSHGSGGQGITGTETYQAPIAQRASTIAESVLKAYEKNHWGQKKKDGRAEVKGLITMLVHQLLIGNNPQAQKMIYAKNRLGGVMYKTKMSTIVRGLSGNKYWAKIIAKKTHRPKLIDHMIALTNRGADEPIYTGYTDPSEERRGTENDRSSASVDIAVKTWLREVLSGTDDKLFDELKNEWSEEIKPPKGIAAVEVRKPQSFLAKELEAVELKLDDPEGVTDYLLEIYKWNRML